MCSKLLKSIGFYGVLVMGLSVGCDMGGDDVDTLPFEPAGPDHAPSPIEMGPYPVGVRTVTFEDPTRTTGGYEGPRQLVCEIWYPATDEARDAVESYVLHEYLPPDLQEQIPAEALGTFNTQALRDAEPRFGRGPFPLIMFSHGKGGIRAQSTFFTVPLASHGYIVVSMDHEGDTIIDLLRTGEVDMNTTVDSFIDRPLDIVFLLDEVIYWDDPLAELIDVEHIGIAGHSFGALTSLRTAVMDSRIKAVVAHTPPGVGTVNLALEAPVSTLNIPVMIHGGKMDVTLPVEEHTDTLWPELTSPAYYLTLETAGHFTYSDMCILDVEQLESALDIDVSSVLNDGCGEENISADVAFDVINHFSIGFFNAFLRDSAPTRAQLTEAKGKEMAPGEVILQIKE